MCAYEQKLQAQITKKKTTSLSKEVGNNLSSPKGRTTNQKTKAQCQHT